MQESLWVQEIRDRRLPDAYQYPTFFRRRRPAPAQHRSSVAQEPSQALLSEDTETQTTRPSYHKSSHRLALNHHLGRTRGNHKHTGPISATQPPPFVLFFFLCLCRRGHRKRRRPTRNPPARNEPSSQRRASEPRRRPIAYKVFAPLRWRAVSPSRGNLGGKSHAASQAGPRAGLPKESGNCLTLTSPNEPSGCVTDPGQRWHQNKQTYITQQMCDVHKTSALTHGQIARHGAPPPESASVQTRRRLNLVSIQGSSSRVWVGLEGALLASPSFLPSLQTGDAGRRHECR